MVESRWWFALVLLASGANVTHGQAFPSAPAIVNSFAASDSASGYGYLDSDPDIASDRAGNMIMVFSNESASGGRIHVRRSADDGATWSDAAILNSSANGETNIREKKRRKNSR